MTSYSYGNATIYTGDALALLPTLVTGSVDAVITDPPYSSGGMFRGDRSSDVKTKYVQTDSARHAVASGALEDFTGDNRDQRGYHYWCTLWLSECRRILTPGGVVAMFTDWRQLPTTTDLLQAGGLVWRGIIPWHKPAGRRVQGRFANTCEYVVWATNGPRALDALDTALPGFFTASPPRDDREHITQKPLDVMRQLVRIAPPAGTILDPFAGSGTTGLAAIYEGRRFVGVELVDHYAKVTADRLALAVRGYRDQDTQLVLTSDEGETP